MNRFEAEHDNFRVALRWARERPEDGTATQLGLRLCGPLFWQLRGYWIEGHDWIEGVLARPRETGERLGSRRR